MLASASLSRGVFLLSDQMFFRFVASLVLVVLVSMVGIGLEKQTLEMKRAVSRQYFQEDLLLEMHARLRLRIQELTAPSQLADLHAQPLPDHTELSNETDHERQMESRSPVRSALPLLRWEHPAPVTHLRGGTMMRSAEDAVGNP